ncbi:hypothetical protein MBLNU459_g7951t1 [Dothideomycetes sp. NU459]
MALRESDSDGPKQQFECGSDLMKQQFCFDPKYRPLNHGVNTVLRNIVYKPGDVIIYFATIYGACEKTVAYISESTEASAHKITYTYPVSDDYLCNAFETAVEEIKAGGKTPKIAVFDTIVSLPGVRMPFERLTALCRSHNVLSLVDGAHGIGHIPIDLSALDPDFFVSNCHKWLFVPRGCALFYVPERNQHLIRSTLPTSHGFVPVEAGAITNPMPLTTKSPFVAGFEFVATADSVQYTCVPAALEFRKACTWNGKSGEEAIIAYTSAQAREAGKLVAKALGTTVMDNDEGTLGRCNLSNVRLPLGFEALTGGETAKAISIARWIALLLVNEYDTYMAIFFHGDAWWVRLSSQIYLTMDDWEWAGGVLKEVCARVEKGEAS